MSPKRAFFMMVGATTLLVVAIVSLTIVGTAMLKKHSTRLVALKLEDTLIKQQQDALLAAQNDIEKYGHLENIANSIVPKDKDQAKTARDIIQIAREYNISIETITFPSSTLGAAQATPAAPTDGSAPPAQPATPPLTQAKPVPGINGVYSLQLDIAPDSRQPITYDELINFLKRLENNRRTAQISRLNITPKGNRLVFSLSINIFIKP